MEKVKTEKYALICQLFCIKSKFSRLLYFLYCECVHKQRRSFVWWQFGDTIKNCNKKRKYKRLWEENDNYLFSEIKCISENYLEIWRQAQAYSACCKLVGNSPNLVLLGIAVWCVLGEVFCFKIGLHPSLQTCPKWKEKNLSLHILLEKFLELGS